MHFNYINENMISPWRQASYNYLSLLKIKKNCGKSQSLLPLGFLRLRMLIYAQHTDDDTAAYLDSPEDNTEL